MNNNIFNSKKDELRIKTNDELEKRLPLLYKAYDKLLQKADPFNYELCSSFEELAKFLGYKIHEVQSLLEDLTRLNLISFESNEEENQYKIKLLVH